MMKRIEEFSDDELKEELLSRYDHAIFGGIKTAIGSSDGLLTKRSYMGNCATCTGIAYQIAYMCTEDAFNNKVVDDE